MRPRSLRSALGPRLGISEKRSLTARHRDPGNPESLPTDVRSALDNLPNLQNLGKLLIGENPEELLECDLKLEQQPVPDLRVATADCETAGDCVSRDLFASILASEEEHIDCIETQLALIEGLGLNPYLQTKLGS